MLPLVLISVGATLTAALAALMVRRLPAGELASQASTLLVAVGHRTRPTDVVQWEDLRQLLGAAGFHHRDAREVFWGIRTLWMLLCAALLFWAMASDLAPFARILAMSAFALGGLYAPKSFLQMRAATMRTAVLRSFPMAVDLLVTCLDAGLGLEHALERVGREIAYSEPVLSRELLVTAGEIDTGVPITEAMKNFGGRVGIDEIDLFCAAVAHGSLLGTSLVPTLREYVAAMRRRRLSELEETTGKRSAKLVLPVTLCLVPAAGIFLLAPTLASVVTTLERMR